MLYLTAIQMLVDLKVSPLQQAGGRASFLCPISYIHFSVFPSPGQPVIQGETVTGHCSVLTCSYDSFSPAGKSTGEEPAAICRCQTESDNCQTSFSPAHLTTFLLLSNQQVSHLPRAGDVFTYQLLTTHLLDHLARFSQYLLGFIVSLLSSLGHLMFEMYFLHSDLFWII